MDKDTICSGSGSADQVSSGTNIGDPHHHPQHQGQSEVGNADGNDAGQSGQGAAGLVNPGMMVTPTSDELMEELATLKATVERQKQLLNNGEEERRKLQKKFARAKLVCKDLLDPRIQERRRLEIELCSLKWQQEELINTVVPLKGTLAQACRQTGIKLEEIRKLTKMVDDIQHKEVKKHFELSTQEGEMNSETGKGWQTAHINFPEEVWRVIIANVSDPRDLWNLCNTCQLFDDILFEWKTGWLLGQALPYVYKDLPGSKLLKCRTICKSWKEAVDNFLENHPSLQAHDAKNCDARRLDFVNPLKEKQLGQRFRINFNSGTDPSLFEDPSFVTKWKRTRFIGRTITLKLGRQNWVASDEVVRWNENADMQCAQMWSTFCGFLQSFGMEVQSLTVACLWNFRCYVDGNNDFEEVWESKIFPFLSVDLFQIFPNLRKLHIFYWRNGSVEDFEELNPQSLPTLAKLETFGTDCWGEALSTAVLKRHHLQLRKLHITVGTWWEVKNLNWPKLTELQFHNTMGTYSSQWDVHIDNHGVILPQLRKLEMQITDNWLTSPEVLLDPICGIATTSHSQLNTVRLSGAFNGIFNEKINRISYVLPQISTLEFEYALTGQVPNFDFLLHCFPLLKNLNVFIKTPNICNDHLLNTEISLDFEYAKLMLRPEFRRSRMYLGSNVYVHDCSHHMEIVDVNSYLYDGTMYKSNIWELLPLLKVFTFQWDIYTRENYEAYRCKRNTEN